MISETIIPKKSHKVKDRFIYIYYSHLCIVQ